TQNQIYRLTENKYVGNIVTILHVYRCILCVHPWKMGNYSTISEFILVGVTSDPTMQIFLYIFFTLVYIITILGNSGIVFIILIIPDLHSPMYFFLGNLSISDLCYSTVIIPKLLHDMFLLRKSITFIGCAIQLYCFALFATTEGFMLSAMAYDRYVAICNPLLYIVIMNRRTCILLVSVVYAGGFIIAGIHTSATISLHFCGPNTINHFYCDIPPLMDLSCSDPYFIFILGFFSVTVVLASYIYIFFTIFQIRSVEGRHKAFSTCAAHLSCVALFYGTVFFMYLRPASNYSVTQDKVVSIFYTVIIPMLNPIIYSLRNKEVKEAVRSSKVCYHKRKYKHVFCAAK
uniref:Olfactory receptor n=1 Tax=Leptobrachium leishanense TaxID=445787 RepID=A0A8C5M2C1_9ANUR